MNANTSIATMSAAGQRTMFHTWATVDPNPMKPSRSSARRPPTKTMTRLTRMSEPSTSVEATSIVLRRRKLRPPGTSNTTFSALRAASSTPVVP
jgi:hypothetical protein